MAQTRKLYRSRTNRKLAGVCGGLAQYFNTDATLIRILFVVLALLGGPGLVIYLLMWILVLPTMRSTSRSRSGSWLLGSSGSSAAPALCSDPARRRSFFPTPLDLYEEH